MYSIAAITAVVIAIAAVAFIALYIWNHRGDYDPENLNSLWEHALEIALDHGSSIVRGVMGYFR